MHYLHGLWHGLPIIPATVGLLGLFAVLNVVGITESAVVALGIFIAHMLTLTVLCLSCGWVVAQDPSLLIENLTTPPRLGFGPALFFGFASAMLGISGFESSANFIEEQGPGVFPKTLRNMWIAVAIFNPLISLLAFGLLPLNALETDNPMNDLLAQMGGIAVGPSLSTVVAIDAVLVLSGAVLTSYVGVTGLVRRMALDRCLPQFLLAENEWRHTNHWIIFGFFGICCSILAVTEGDVEVLAGVYIFSFLSVMALFATGNLLLKGSRGKLPRDTRASWPAVVIALGAVLLGLIGNLIMDIRPFIVFLTYLAIAGAIVGVMFLRVELLRLGLFVVGSVSEQTNQLNEWVRTSVRTMVHDINKQAAVYFTKGDDPAELNRAALYVLQNEQTNRLTVVHVYDDEGDIPPHLADHLRQIDRQYPALRIDLLVVKGEFGPDLIEALSERLDVPKNYMFLGTPGDRFPHRLETLGGVRLIL
ncbi:MAG: APC family permease [Myxococcota bacterium]